MNGAMRARLFERELGLALECAVTTSSRPEEPQSASRRDTAQGLAEQELQEAEVQEGTVGMQEQEGLLTQIQELGQPAVGDQQVEVVDGDNAGDF